MTDSHAARVAGLAGAFDEALGRFIARVEHAGARASAAPAEGGWSLAQIAWHVAAVNESFATIMAGGVTGAKGPTASGAAVSEPMVDVAYCRGVLSDTLSGKRRTNHAEGQLDDSNGDDIAIAKHHRSLCQVPSDERAILAAEVFELCAALHYANPGVTTRHAWRIEHDVGLPLTTDDVVALPEHGAAAFPYQTADGDGRAGPRVFDAVTVKRVSEAMDGADETRFSRVITKCVPDLANKIGEVGFDDEGVGPQPVVQRRFRQGLRPILDQDLEELKSLRRQRDALASADEFARIRVKDEAVECQTHVFP
jgi:hypothetical protein